jgi:hypothetical protein
MTDYASWQRTGELCDAVVASGLHQGNSVDAQTPFFLSELRKRIFTSVYSRDKVQATFLGRPPRLSYRYCKMDMPLDLKDDQLFSTGPELEYALAHIDSDGWNTEGNLTLNTWLRVMFQESRLREEILEVALGPYTEDLQQRAAEIRQMQERLHASFPEFMKISPEEALNTSENSSSSSSLDVYPRRQEKGFRQLDALFIVCIHAGIMHTEFLLQRAMVNRMKTDTKLLIPISRRLLKLVLLAYSKKDFFRDFQGDLIWLLASNGMPAAGVLAVELLRQEQTRQFTPDLPRSETIQDISVFVSALAAVGPDEGIHGICNQGRRALRRVLDQILSPSIPPPAANPGAENLAGGGKAFDEMSFFMPTGNDVDFLQWLESVEWEGIMNPALATGDAV